MHEDLDRPREVHGRQFPHERAEVERPAAGHLQQLVGLRQLLLESLAVLLGVDERELRPEVAGECRDETAILRQVMRGERHAHA